MGGMGWHHHRNGTALSLERAAWDGIVVGMGGVQYPEQLLAVIRGTSSYIVTNLETMRTQHSGPKVSYAGKYV